MGTDGSLLVVGDTSSDGGLAGSRVLIGRDGTITSSGDLPDAPRLKVLPDPPPDCDSSETAVWSGLLLVLPSGKARVIVDLPSPLVATAELSPGGDEVLVGIFSNPGVGSGDLADRSCLSSEAAGALLDQPVRWSLWTGEGEGIHPLADRAHAMERWYEFVPIFECRGERRAGVREGGTEGRGIVRRDMGPVLASRIRSATTRRRGSPLTVERRVCRDKGYKSSPI